MRTMYGITFRHPRTYIRAAAKANTRFRVLYWRFILADANDIGFEEGGTELHEPQRQIVLLDDHFRPNPRP